MEYSACRSGNETDRAAAFLALTMSRGPRAAASTASRAVMLAGFKVVRNARRLPIVNPIILASIPESDILAPDRPN